MNLSNSYSIGIRLVGLLTIVFVALKLTRYVDWSWWWVVSPIWIAAIVVALVLAAFAVWRLIGRR